MIGINRIKNYAKTSNSFAIDLYSFEMVIT